MADQQGLGDLSFWTRDPTQALAVKVPSPNHCTAREFCMFLIWVWPSQKRPSCFWAPVITFALLFSLNFKVSSKFLSSYVELPVCTSCLILGTGGFCFQANRSYAVELTTISQHASSFPSANSWWGCGARGCVEPEGGAQGL